LVEGGLTPSAADREALAWVETHPPDALHVPPMVRNAPAAAAFRSQGLWHHWSDKKALGDADGSVALDGPLAWIWDQSPPVPVRDALAALCGDVSHLGTTESPVVLGVGEIEPTHRRDPRADPFHGGGIEVEIAQTGRVAALEAAHEETLRPVSPARDGVKADEIALAPRVERSGLATARYVAIPAARRDQEVLPSPWESALVLPIRASVAPRARVAWAVALHRALIALIGDGAPSVLTGRYAPGVPRPANRLAIQYVWRGLPLAFDLLAAAFVLLLPADTDAIDRRALSDALRQLTRLHVSADRTVEIDATQLEVVPADAFWAAPAPNRRRVWTTEPAAIPESFAVRGQAWTLEDAALLSVALLWRDALGGRGRGRTWYARLADAARAHGVQIHDAHRLHTQGLQRFVHRVQSDMVIQPYRATLSLGDLGGEQTVLAIGQSRHLGGGLLVPTDLPQDPAERA
jgi:CRISPR-associated protein Csb2